MTTEPSSPWSRLFTLVLFVAIAMQLNAFLWIVTGEGVYALDTEMSALARYYSIPRQLLLALLIVVLVAKGGIVTQLRIHAPSLVILLYWAVSTTWSANDDDSRRAITLLLMQFTIGAATLIGVTRDQFFERLRHLAFLFLLLNLAFAALFPHQAIETRLYVGAFRGVLVGKNVFGHVLCYFLAFYLVVLFAQASPVRRRQWLVLALYIALLGLSQSASSILACALVALAYLVLTRLLLTASSREPRLMIGVATLIPTGLALLNAEAFVDLIAPLLGRDASLTGRDTLWTFAQAFIEQSPIVGYGFGGFWPQFSNQEGLLRDYGLWDIGQIHNGFIEAQLLGGVIGLSLTVTYLALLAWKTLKRLAEDPRDPVGALAFAMIGLTLVLNTTESDFPGLGRMAFIALVIAWGALKLFPATVTAQRPAAVPLLPTHDSTS